MALIINYFKKWEFVWTKATFEEFIKIKHKMIEAPILRHPNLSKVLEVHCDALGIRVDGVLSQKGYPISFL